MTAAIPFIFYNAFLPHIWQSLETKRRKIQQELVKQRQCLHEAHEEQRALEKILDNTAQMYNRAHVERHDLVANWRRAVTELHARERAVRDTIEV